MEVQTSCLFNNKIEFLFLMPLVLNCRVNTVDRLITYTKFLQYVYEFTAVFYPGIFD